MNTIYQLRGDITNVVLGLYMFDDVTVTDQQIRYYYFNFAQDENFEDFDSYLKAKNVKFTRLFVEEVYV